MSQLKKDIRYLNKDFSQFRLNLIEFAKNYFPNTYNDFNESSPGMMFIEMAAYVGDVLSYYTDNQLKESLLDFAQTRPNVLSLASNVGYQTKNTIPSTVNLDIFQLLPAKTTAAGKVPDWSYALTVRENMRVTSTENDIEFRTVSLVNFALSSSFDPTEVTVYQVNEIDNTPEFYLLKKRVKAISGTRKISSFTFEAAKRFDRILINDQDIIEITGVTDSDNNTWTEVPYLAQDTIFETVANTIQNDPELSQYTDVPYLLKLKKTARRFTTKFRSDGKLIIQFGPGVSIDQDEEIIPNPDNVGSSLNGLRTQFDHPIDPSNFMYTKTYGLAPSNTSLTVYYTTGGGAQSNVSSFTITNIIDIIYQIDSSNLDTTLLNRIKASVAVTNPDPATGGKSQETLDEIRQNAMAAFAAQQRAITAQDYIVRTYSMPSKFGAVSKAYIIQDQQINPDNGQEMIPNPLALNLYVLGYNSLGNLTEINEAVKQNLRTYLSPYRMLTDAVNIKNASIINIGVRFEIVTLPEYNSNEVLLRCIEKLKTIFDIRKWQINQPIIVSKLYTELDRIEGVQTVSSIEIVNLYGESSGYSRNIYDIKAATKSGVIYPSLDPSIFEIKYPNQDITGKVNAL